MINDVDFILNDTQTDLARLNAVKDRLTASNTELDHINEELEPLLPTGDLEIDCATVAIQTGPSEFLRSSGARSKSWISADGTLFLPPQHQ